MNPSCRKPVSAVCAWALLASVALVSGCSMPSAQRDATIDGAGVGAVSGALVAAWPVFTQGAGGGSSSALPWLAAGPVLGALAGAGVGYVLARQGAGGFGAVAPQPASRQSTPSLLN